MDSFVMFVYFEEHWHFAGLYDYLMQADRLKEQIEEWASRHDKEIEVLTLQLPAPAKPSVDVDGEFRNMLKNFPH